MSFRAITQCFVLAAILLASFASPGNVQASSVCGSTYVVQWGDTLGKIAQRCGTTVTALYAANPWLGYTLYAGSVLVIPGGGYSGYSGYSYSNIYYVRRGDTFSEIAKRYGVSVNALWSANRHIWNINRIYPGQAIYVPTLSAAPASSSWFNIVPTSSEPLVERSYGEAPVGAPTGRVKLINNANAEVYVSLQGTTNDGVKVINEYPVGEPMRVKVPAGWYLYVAWVGGEKFSGEFQLHGDETVTLAFYANRVAVK